MNTGIQQPVIHPRIYPWAPEKPLDPVMATLTRLTKRTLVSITGGCAKANMTLEEGQETIGLFTTAFEGFCGAMLIGGSRMIADGDPARVLFGITEIAPAIRRYCPESYVLGVVPRLQEVVFDMEMSMLRIVHTIGERDAPDHTTIVHPEQDLVVVVTRSLRPQLSRWYDEVEFRRYVSENLCTYGGWDSLLIAYNGGDITESEVRETAARGWPVLLIKDSGRISDQLAHDSAFLQEHPSVHVCEHSAASLRRALVQLNVLPPDAPNVRHLEIA